MNVLLVTLGNRTEGMQEWSTRLRTGDRLTVLRYGHGQLSERPGTHDLEQILVATEYRRWPKKAFEIAFNDMRRTRQLWGSRVPALTVWNLIAHLRVNTLVNDIQSFDPDIVDLRFVPNDLGFTRKLSSALPHASILSHASRVESPDTSWRVYDPRLKVSIVLPVFNGEKFLRQSIESCLQQTHRAIELVIVDDCSTDSTPEIIKEYAKRDHRIVSLRNPSNLHLPRTLDEGFRNTTGSLLTWTSHDNYYAPEAIEFLVSQLCSRQKIDLTYTAFYQVDEHDRVDPRVIYLPEPKYISLLNVVGPCFMYRRRVYEKSGGYRVDMEYQEDYEYWLRVSTHSIMMRFHNPLYFYRRHAHQLSAKRTRDPSVVKSPINLEYSRLRNRTETN
jgi:hypothetical protein